MADTSMNNFSHCTIIIWQFSEINFLPDKGERTSAWAIEFEPIDTRQVWKVEQPESASKVENDVNFSSSEKRQGLYSSVKVFSFPLQLLWVFSPTLIFHYNLQTLK